MVPEAIDGSPVLRRASESSCEAQERPPGLSPKLSRKGKQGLLLLRGLVAWQFSEYTGFPLNVVKPVNLSNALPAKGDRTSSFIHWNP